MYLSITEAAAALRAGETTASALVDDCIDVADRYDGDIGVFLARYTESAKEAAAQADEKFAKGIDEGPLQGIPLGIKDIITTAEGETTAQSLVLDRSWGQGDAPVVARLRAAGGVIMGKLTTMEYAIGMPDETKPFPYPHNPWSLDHYAGGSSSGKGSGVASGMVLGGLGTDTGGSIRWPSAVCGISGIKATFGRVPKSGCVPLGYSYDNIGPMARTVEDCALMLGVLAGHDASDPCSSTEPVADYLSGLTGSLDGVRIGLDTLERFCDDESWDPSLTALIADFVATLEAAGAVVVPVELPYYRELTSATFQGFSCEAYAYHRPDLQSRWDDFSAGARMAVAAGALIPAGDYVQMQRVRRAGQRLVAELFTDVDLLLTPTTSWPAPRVEQTDLGPIMPTLHTPYWNAVGNPALAVPAGFNAEGLPMSMQIVGPPFGEAGVLAAGYAYQQRTDFHRQLPPIVAAHLEGAATA